MLCRVRHRFDRRGQSVGLDSDCGCTLKEIGRSVRVPVGRRRLESPDDRRHPCPALHRQPNCEKWTWEEDRNSSNCWHLRLRCYDPEPEKGPHCSRPFQTDRESDPIPYRAYRGLLWFVNQSSINQSISQSINNTKQNRITPQINALINQSINSINQWVSYRKYPGQGRKVAGPCACWVRHRFRRCSSAAEWVRLVAVEVVLVAAAVGHRKSRKGRPVKARRYRLLHRWTPTDRPDASIHHLYIRRARKRKEENGNWINTEQDHHHHKRYTIDDSQDIKFPVITTTTLFCFSLEQLVLLLSFFWCVMLVTVERRWFVYWTQRG